LNINLLEIIHLQITKIVLSRRKLRKKKNNKKEPMDMFIILSKKQIFKA